MTKYDLLVKSGKKLFNVDDLVAIWSETDRRDALESIKGYVNRGKVFSLYKGIYSLEEDYNTLQLGQKLFTPSYISYYSALTIHGIIFQKYQDTHLFAETSKKILIDSNNYIYHKVKIDILLNRTGLVINNHYTIASKERAICDSLYINKGIAFDNLRDIDIDKLSSISKIYKNKRLERDVKKLIVQIKE